MLSSLEKMFDKIGAKVRIVYVDSNLRVRDASTRIPSTRLNIINENQEEIFEIAIRKDLSGNIDLSVLEVKPLDRHLVLLSRQVDEKGAVISKNHFLCGHDERHLFVASVDSVSTVAMAKASLKPWEIIHQETGLKTGKRNRRKTKIFKRQGEWFFIPSDLIPDPNFVIRGEPLSRGRGSKPHIAEFAYRYGGEVVKVCDQYPNGLTIAQYNALVRRTPRALHFKWQDRRRNAAVFVKGRIKHADHATVVLDSWHRVLMNTERRSDTVAFLD